MLLLGVWRDRIGGVQVLRCRAASASFSFNSLQTGKRIQRNMLTSWGLRVSTILVPLDFIHSEIVESIDSNCALCVSHIPSFLNPANLRIEILLISGFV